MSSREQLTLAALVLLLCAYPASVSMAAGVFQNQASESLEIGDEAPDFELTDHNGVTVRLSQFRGSKNVIVAFYVLAFTGG